MIIHLPSMWVGVISSLLPMPATIVEYGIEVTLETKLLNRQKMTRSCFEVQRKRHEEYVTSGIRRESINNTNLSRVGPADPSFF